jgi:hypothetical protein
VSDTKCPDERENCPLCRIKDLEAKLEAAEARIRYLEAVRDASLEMLFKYED